MNTFVAVDTDFEMMLANEVAAFGGSVNERIPAALFAREWHIKLPENPLTIAVYWDEEEGIPRASPYMTEDSLSRIRVHNMLIDTVERVRGYLLKQGGSPR